MAAVSSQESVIPSFSFKVVQNPKEEPCVLITCPHNQDLKKLYLFIKDNDLFVCLKTGDQSLKTGATSLLARLRQKKKDEGKNVQDIMFFFQNLGKKS